MKNPWRKDSVLGKLFELRQREKSLGLLPPVKCSQCEVTADTVLDMSRHWVASGHRGCTVKVGKKKEL